MKKNKYAKYALVSLSLLLVLATGYSASETKAQTSAEASIETTVSNITLTASEIASYYKDNDKDASFSTESSTLISLNTTSAEINGDGASFENGNLTITKAGTYVLSGKLNGSVIVNASKDDFVRIVLNGAEITSDKTSAIYSMQADKTVIILARNTENILTDAKEYTYKNADDTEPNAALFAKNNLSITGSGSLTVNGNFNNGIGTKDDLRITGGNITVNAENNGLKGNDSVRVLDGTITINSKSDGIKSDNTEDADKGFIMLNGGTFNITSGNDGIQAENALTVTGGKYTIVSGGGSVKEFEIKTEEQGMGGNGTAPEGGTGERPERPDNSNGTTQMGTPPERSEDADSVSSATKNTENNIKKPSQNGVSDTTSSEEDESTSSKGIKSSKDMLITGGSFNIDSLDDAVHSNGSIVVSDGTFIISTDDDAFHADANLTINGGGITVTTCYEGLEGNIITINDGTIDIKANDDGINAAGENSAENGMGFEDPNAQTSDKDEYYLKITGGTVKVSANGDGLDSNGSIYIEGGTTIVDGPTSNGNGALDYDGSGTVSGGILVATGSSGMVQTFADTSTQNTIMVIYSETQKAGTALNITNSEGASILTYVPEKDYQSVVVTSPKIVQGETYTLNTGGESDSKEVAGLYVGGTYTNGTKVCEITVSSASTKVNDDGTAYERSGGMGQGGGPGGSGRSKSPQGTKTQTESTNE